MENVDDVAAENVNSSEETLSLEEHQARGARTAWRVIGGILTLATILGVLAYYNYSHSSAELNAAFVEMGQKGATVDTEGCVPVVMEWHRTCDGMKTLCDHAVPMAMTHCLSAPDAPEARASERKAYCDAFSWPSSKAKWTYAKCKEIGFSKDAGEKRDRVKACGNAFGTIENFCRHGGKGVRL